MNKQKEEYINELTSLMSILHDMKHAGTLPKKLEKKRSFIETFDPSKLNVLKDDSVKNTVFG
ncbi:MAG: hypothetical protein WC346_06795 [Methanogenium sp.]|jgi:hypothetical protein